MGSCFVDAARLVVTANVSAIDILRFCIDDCQRLRHKTDRFQILAYVDGSNGMFLVSSWYLVSDAWRAKTPPRSFVRERSFRNLLIGGSIKVSLSGVYQLQREHVPHNL